MFRIVMYALWSRDYVAVLARLLEDTLRCPIDEAKTIVDGLANGNPKEFICATPGIAYELSTDLLQFGVYTQVEQVGPVTDADIAADMALLMYENLSDWRVYYDAQGVPRRLVETYTRGFLSFERQGAMDLVAVEAQKRGALPIGPEEMDALIGEVEAAREERVRYAKMMMRRYGRDWKQILWEMRTGQRPAAHGPALEEE